MAIKVSGTTVIDDSRNIQNVGTMTASNVSGNITINKYANETINIVSGTINGNNTINVVDSGSVHLFTSNSTSTWTPNIRGNSSTTLDSIISIGQVITVSLISKQNSASYYSSSLNIDGSSRTVNWQGATVPSDGSTSGYDAYVYTICKTASNTFTVLGSKTAYS